MLVVPGLIFLLSIIHESVQFQYIKTFIEEFQFKYLTLIGSSNDINSKLLKTLFMDDQFLNTSLHSFETSSSIGIISTDTIIYLNSQTKITEQLRIELSRHPQFTIILISQSLQFEQVLNSCATQFEIHQKIYLFKKDTQELYEAYKINEVIVKNKIGNIDSNTGKFKWQPHLTPDFIKRRSNFHGIVLKGMTEFSGLNMNANPKYFENEHFQNNETYYLVTGLTYGLFNDVLGILQDRLNFTTQLYKRKDGVWGYFNEENGTILATGIMKDIYLKRAEFAAAPLYYTIDRVLYVNFLPSITTYVAAIYIPKTTTEVIDFDTFIAPFNYPLWFMLISATIFFAMMKILLFKIHGNKNFQGFNIIWRTFIGFFGGKPSRCSIDSISSYKTVILSTLLCGTVIWIAYRAGLTTELSVRVKTYPFTDMKSFSKTDWR